jgi:hypothetical protein
MSAVLVLWANFYGSVLLGAGLVVLYAGYRAISALRPREHAGHPDRRAIAAYFTLGALAAASVLCCPYGIRIIAYYERFGGPVVERYDKQWGPPTLHSALCWTFFALAAATTIIVAGAWRRGIRPEPVLSGLAAVLLIAAITTYKDVAWFGLAGSLLAADTFTRAAAGHQAGSRPLVRNSVAAATSALAIAAIVATARTPDSGFEVQIPSQAITVAAAVARAHPGWRVLSDDWDSTAMVWLQPSMLGRVGLDLRLEQYTAAQLSSWFDFLNVAGPHWQSESAGYNVIVCSGVRYPALAAAAPDMAGWRVVYSDRDGVVLVRNASSPTSRG